MYFIFTVKLHMYIAACWFQCY